MAKIPLRAYVQEIENLIERGEIEPAVAHAKNILKTYPKHIETYRLLGKAFLESQRYTQALDILQRVLSVIPDDFISQIGMSIIREDEGNLDQAIWHMERAYEVQPFNPAVQDELRRLYGRRDGVQPPKIRLTRGALVRMYARGELYPQATAETLAALAEDPNRTDLEVLLARLYYLSKQKIEAIEACSRLLKHLPYCKEALEILTRVLPETNRASDAPYYLQRLYTLDPYAAFVSPNATTSDQVPEQAVMVERFNLDMSMAEVQAPEWTQNIGVQWEEPEGEDLPDWLNTLKPGSEAGMGAAAAFAAETSVPAEDTGLPAEPADELMPEFLKDAGWTQSDRRADDIMKESLMQESGEEEAAAPAEIPDWLQSIAPAQEAGAQEEDERTGWLDSILPTSEGANGTADQTAQPDELLLVDGLDSELDADLAADLPDWLSEMEQGTAETTGMPETLSSDVPDWLSTIAPTQGADTDDVTASGIGASDQPEAEQSLDWLSGLEQPEQPAAESLSAAGSDETPDWMASLAQPEEEAAAPAGDMPDWLKGLGQHPGDTKMLNLGDDAFDMPESAAPVSDQPAAEGLPAADVPGVPDWLESLETEPQQEAPTGALAADAEDSTGWMAAFTEGEQPETGQVDAESEALAADIPEWMQGLAPTEEEQAQAKSALFDANVPETLETITPETASETAMPDMNDMDATMAWLESLAAKQGADEATLLITNPDQRTETPPDWVQQQSTLPAAEETQPAEAADVPEWLAELSPTGQDEIPHDTITQNESVSTVEDVEAFIPGREQGMVETSLPDADAAPTITEPAAVEATPTESDLGQPDLSDVDATMAWLEALAARQGADEATLITPPDQRTDTPPDWVQQAAEQPEDVSLPDLGAAATDLEATEVEAENLPEWLQDLEKPAAEVISSETEPQLLDSEVGFAKIFDIPERSDESAELQQTAALEVEDKAVEDVAASAESIWPVDSFAGDEIAQQAAEATMISETESTAEAPSESAAPTASQEAMPDLTDMDATMAWLESLAAKQGADEATLLITNPEQRTDTPPEWIQKQASAAEGLPAAEELPATSELPELTAEEELPDWLSSLDQPSDETAAGETEAVWPVDSYAGDQIAEEAAAVEIIESDATAAEVANYAETGEAAPETPLEAGTVETPAGGMPDMNDMDAAMAWLEALAAKQGADEATLLISDPEQRSETPPEWIRKQTGELKLPEEQAPAESAQVESLPDWLQIAEQQDTTPAEEKTQPLGKPSTADRTPAETSAADETAAWLESLNTTGEDAAVSGQAVETPETEQTGSELMPQWLTSLEEESEALDYLSAEEETAAVPVDISSAWVPEEAAPETELQQMAEASDSAPDGLSLPDLQSALRRGDLDRALDGYGQLIRNGQMLDETIHDLRDALYRYPVDIMIWQTLGDAYAQNNQLQEALDAYTKAEELLR